MQGNSKLTVSTETSVKVGWLHRDATSLITDDAVELKHALKGMIEQATVALESVRADIKAERARLRAEETMVAAQG